MSTTPTAARLPASPVTGSIRHTVLRYGYAPLLLLGANGAAVHLIASNAPRGWLLALLLGAVGLSFLVEHIIPYEVEWNRSHGDALRDVLHAVVNEVANLVSLATLPLITALVTVADLWPRQWPFVLQLLFALLVFDFGVTLTHFASHKLPLLWRFHAVHHSVKRFYGFNGLMKHPVHQALEMTVGVLPLVLIGLPEDVATALAFCTAIQLLLQHSNADYRMGALRYVLALNEGHRFHHLKWAGIGDVNFGLFTHFWDCLLGTFTADPKKRFTTEELGIGKQPDYPTAYFAQILEPFRTYGREAPRRPGR
ncbi:sterol desaturase family protein [Vitiosangium sp. GDMCC 1.1324]|uniref:sterol desaturase family protein n=1 Tax=Vitiosangium sp. (strain GDMCC 1.1324) TaxID=2138576 RepID=UPI000D3BBDC9|nr:sterol desaturase family protein [Vitiosangium sp. GDMCC 1.1324]PTL83395.1 fatty acid hydroxylase [Vitiosangium sp. GDMCC 1.1324]